MNAVLAAGACSPGSAQAPTQQTQRPAQAAQAERIAALVDPIIEADLAASGAPGAAFIFVRNGRVVYQRGYGFADVASGTKSDPERTVWPIASITKTVTAVAALQLVDRGRIELDRDINSYLKRLKVPARGYGPLTLRHLLSHTGGLDEIPGRQFDGKARPEIASFLRGKIVRFRAPGERTAYSTYGIALAALLVEDVSGRAYSDYVRENILRPAGLERSWIMNGLGDERGVATPYALKDGEARPIPHEWYVTTSTSSMVASAADMGRLLLLHLADGRAGSRQILSPRLTREMRRQQATVHPALPGWGLGMQLDRLNGLDIAEHGGDIGGFAALFALIPERRAGFFIVHHGEGGNLRFRVKQALLDGLYPAAEPVAPPAPDAAQAARLAEYAGRYISSMACRTCRDGEPDIFEVKAAADGTLSLWGQRWIPQGRDLFVRDDGKRLLGFARNRQGRVDSVSGGSFRVADRID